MNKIQLVSLLLASCGVLLLILALLRGEVQVGIVVIIPFIIGSGLFATGGILCIIAALFLYMFGSLQQYKIHESRVQPDTYHEATPKKIQGGGVLFIGPIPIVFGSTRTIALYFLCIALVILLVFLLLKIFFNY